MYWKANKKNYIYFDNLVPKLLESEFLIKKGNVYYLDCKKCNEHRLEMSMMDVEAAASDSGMYTSSQIEKMQEELRYFEVNVLDNNRINWNNEYVNNFDPSYYISEALPDDTFLFQTYRNSKLVCGGTIKAGEVIDLVRSKEEFILLKKEYLEKYKNEEKEI